MVVCILNRCHPHPGTLGREYAAAAAFLSRRHLPRGIGCYTVAQTQNWTRPKNTKNWTQAAGKKTPSSKRRLGSGFVEALLISCHMVQLSDQQHDLNVCQQWNFHRITWFPGDPSQGPTQLPCTLSVIPCQSFSLSRRFYFVTTRLAKLNFQRVALSFLLWVAKSVCVMACPCGSVPVGVETLHERLSCSQPGKKVAA